ncbi:alkaline phosphatase D family protein [Erythrobacter mangrovi]|uniref:Alkaline phosphatase D family protein n=1 Tax=Erythrobacter mangrovi TaxID=2739433 RepID=A0A7D3XHV4_9SPHN|nr:alkaline phosphatase D family protein [Erythrobacter mangrovi]QKG70799.1 alkaline phosphatase D family protein [Erythrobacter mangrovi]
MTATEPPQAPRLPAVDRRTLLKGGLLGGGLLTAPLAAHSEAGFTHGVASGEPGSGRVLLWTRYVASQSTTLEWQVSGTSDFTNTVAAGSASAQPENDWCTKDWAEGLTPGTWYYYRFVAPDGSVSDVGRTKTLPEGPTERFRMAVFSCSNIGFGWFNAYAHAAAADEFDCALHLGDYLYEYPSGTYPSAAQTVHGRSIWPAQELVALADYRERYAAYRRDPDLRRLHQLYPMISVWDDHESANDSWKDGAENHQSETEGDWGARKSAAMKAYREWMPVSDENWASYEIGDLATLFRLETRLTGRAKQFSLAEILSSGGGDPDKSRAALAAFRDGAWLDSSREMIGADQQAWLVEGFKRSKGAGKTWQVLVQQVLMGRIVSSPTIAEALPKDVPDYVRRRVLSGAMAGAEGVPFNMDAWDGYPAARARVFEAALTADANLISLAGDTHNAWAFDLDLDGAPVGIEFGVQSVASPGLESSLPQIPAETLVRSTVEGNSQLKWMDASQRGYMAVELRPGSATSEYRFLTSVHEKGAGLAGTKRITTLAGSNRLA